MSKNESRCYVGFDTSNYTTSAAVCVCEPDGTLRVTANCKIPLPVGEGERGLRQSDAVFHHTRHLPAILDQLSEAVGDSAVWAVGCSSKPRDAEDSYMPCFLVGQGAAEAYGAGAKIPTYRVSHQSGHIMAALYGSGALEEGLLREPECLAFHVSGGTTEAVIARPRTGGFDVEIVGGTKDLHAGQVIDRIGVKMGLAFPCGAEMERLADTYTGKIPSMKRTVTDGYCNLSGIENRAAQLFEQTGDKAAVSAFVLDVIAKTLVDMTNQIRESRGAHLPVVYAGGVMSNQRIRPMLQESVGGRVYFAPPVFSADNAAGVALLTALLHKES